MKLVVEFTFAQKYGRLPTPKTGGPMKVKKGRGSYTRKDKHKINY